MAGTQPLEPSVLTPGFMLAGNYNHKSASIKFRHACVGQGPPTCRAKYPASSHLKCQQQIRKCTCYYICLDVLYLYSFCWFLEVNRGVFVQLCYFFTDRTPKSYSCSRERGSPPSLVLTLAWYVQLN